MSDPFKYMPIQRTPVLIRMDALDERQAQINHGQTLQRLAERGGLSPCEALALIERRRWKRTDFGEALSKLLELKS